MRKIIVSLAVVLFILTYANAQTITDDEDIQSWNDVQLNVLMTKHFGVFTRLTLRFGNNISRLNDGRYAFGFVWKPIKNLSVTPFYWYINARNARSRFRTENRLSVQAAYRFPFKKFGLTHRSTYEYRYRGVGDTWRYRAALIYDHDLPKKFLAHSKFFIGDEIFYDSGANKFTRDRFSIGITRNINKKLSLDVYYMRQNDGYAHPGDLNTIWTAWKIHL